MKTINFECTQVRLSWNTLSNPILIFEDGSQFDYSQRFERIIVGSIAQTAKSLTVIVVKDRHIDTSSELNAIEQVFIPLYDIGLCEWINK